MASTCLGSKAGSPLSSGYLGESDSASVSLGLDTLKRTIIETAEIINH